MSKALDLPYQLDQSSEWITTKRAMGNLLAKSIKSKVFSNPQLDIAKKQFNELSTNISDSLKAGYIVQASNTKVFENSNDMEFLVDLYNLTLTNFISYNNAPSESS